MARARYQVLVIPYCIQDDQVQFCLFRRSDMGIWQFIAGGGEENDISIIESARSTHTTSIRQQQNRSLGSESAHCAWNVGIEHFHYVAIFQGRVPCQDGAAPPCTNSIKITVFCQKPISFEIGFFLLPAAARIFYYPEYRRNVRTAGACNFAPFCVPW